MEIIRLILVVAGLVWLLLWQLRGNRVPWGKGLVPLIYLFIISQFVRHEENTFLFVACDLLVVLAFAGICSRKEVFAPLSRLDKGVFLLCGLALFANLTTQFTMGLESGTLPSERWRGTALPIEIVLIYVVVSRLLRGPRGQQHELYLIAVPTVALLIAGLMGIWQIGRVLYYHNQAIEGFAVGRYVQAAAHASHLQPQEQGLRFAPLAVEDAVEEMAKIAGRAGTPEKLMALGDIASQAGLWYQAQQAYQEVIQRETSYPTVCARLGTVLFEQAKIDSALLFLHQGVAQQDAGAEDHLALTVALVRMSSWKEANRALDQVLLLSGLGEEFGRRRDEAKIAGPLGKFLPPLFLLYARKVSMFAVVRLLEDRGWKVLHLAMEIGKTGISAPVDIAVYSGGGGSFVREDIILEGRSISLRKRGYNLAVIEPDIGKLDTVVWFDQGNTQGIVSFSKNIPEGSIVALSANEDIATSVTMDVFRELWRLGGDRFPSRFCSYSLIGVKGTERSKGIDAVGDRNLIVAGVLGANIPADVAGNPAQLEAALREAAAKAPAGIAVYLPSLEPEARLVAVRR